MATPFVSHRRVEFSDTDAAGIMHFARFFIFMESAEHAFLRSLGLSVLVRHGEEIVSWPRVAASCDYRSPAKFDDELTIETSVAQLGSKSVTYTHKFLAGERLIAEGRMTAVCCRLEPGQPPKSMPIPESIVALLAAHRSDD